MDFKVVRLPFLSYEQGSVGPDGLCIMDFMDFQSKSVWIMDFLCIFHLNPYGLWIFYGMDMDLGF